GGVFWPGGRSVASPGGRGKGTGGNTGGSWPLPCGARPVSSTAAVSQTRVGGMAGPGRAVRDGRTASHTRLPPCLQGELARRQPVGGGGGRRSPAPDAFRFISCVSFHFVSRDSFHDPPGRSETKCIRAPFSRTSS